MAGHRLEGHNRLALLMHDYVRSPNGKMGFGLMRYGIAKVAVVIDHSQTGGNLKELTGIDCSAPIVGSVSEALQYNPDTLVPAIAPPGGLLPESWEPEIKLALSSGMSLVNGLHKPMANDPAYASLLKYGRFIWDIRQEPAGLDNGLGRARELPCKRVLFVGTDMANGKMTAALEMHAHSLKRGLKSAFVATGQIGIAIAGDGVPLDAVRVDFATGAVESSVMKVALGKDIVFVEGQGSLLHPASTATLALMRGAMPTELILVHRAGQTHNARARWAEIPALSKVVALNETVCSAAGSLPFAKCCGIALNTAGLSEAEAQKCIHDAQHETGLPVTDVVRFGSDMLLDAVLNNK